MKKTNDSQKFKPSRQPTLLAMLGLLFVCSGGVFAFLTSLTPLKNHATSSQLPNSPASLTGIIPATLKNPVNILILGIDNSGHPHKSKYTPSEALAGNSDTMLLVRLIPKTHEINVLSIPRDTRVILKGTSTNKINDANVVGGPKLAATTISDLLAGVPVDRYIRVDTEGFIHLVDALGGVEVNVPKKMDYTDKTQKLSIHFSPGRQKLNGQHLQEYIRFRHDGLGDIGRVQRQQEVLTDILHTLLKPGTIGKLPKILEVVKDNVDSDLSVDEMLAVAETVFTSDRRQLHLIMLPGRFSNRGEYKLSYWLGAPQATNKIVKQYFNPDLTKLSADNIDSTQPKNLKVAVLSATGNPASAAKVVSFLKKHGYENVYVTNHEIDTATVSGQKTQIIAQHGNPEAANLVSKTLGAGQVQVASVGDILSDVTIVVGSDLLKSVNSKQ